MLPEHSPVHISLYTAGTSSEWTDTDSRTVDAGCLSANSEICTEERS